MDNILIGVFKSDHKMSLKSALVDKLLDSDDKLVRSEETLDLNRFIQSLEQIWLNNDLSSEKLQLNYQHLKENNQLLKKVLGHFIAKSKNRSTIALDCDLVQNKLMDLYLNVFDLKALSPQIASANEIYNKKNYLTLAFAWTSLLIDSFANSEYLKLKFNSLNILHFINQNLNEAFMINYLYFLQNDAAFSAEYLNLVYSYDLFDLNIIDQANSNNESVESRNLNAFLEAICFATAQIIIKSVGLKQLALFSKDTRDYELNVSYRKEQFLLKNFGFIIKLFQCLITKTNRMFELSLKYLIDNVLIEDTESRLSLSAAELFKCFDLNRSLKIIRQPFYEETDAKSQIEDATLKKLLLNLVYLLKWPLNNTIDEWICSFMSLLATQARKFQVLIQVCEETIDYVLSLILNSQTRTQSLNVLAFFLINYQHSPKLFHKCCAQIAKALAYYKKAETKQAKERNSFGFDCKEAHEHLAMLTFVCMRNFGGYPQIYKPLVDLMQNDQGDLTHFDSFKSKYLINSDAHQLFSASNSQHLEASSDELQTHEAHSAKHRSITGLDNLGNTCYLNSMIQSLYACKKFVKSILEVDAYEPTVSTNTLLNTNSFLLQLQILFTMMHLTNRGSIRANNFVKFCTPSWFKLGQQQDTSEFLIFLLDNLNEQLKKPVINEQYAGREKIILKTFGIELTTECVCENCKLSTKRKDTCFCLHLTLAPQSNNNEKQSLQCLIDNFFATEQLSSENGNMYSCANCASLQKASKRISFTRSEHSQPPDYLIFALNRFIYKLVDGSVQNLKIMDQVECPKEISVNTWSGTEKIIEKYQLISIIVHSGSSIHHGHYYSYVKHETIDETTWLCANDPQISVTTYESLISSLEMFKNDTPYVLFYRKVSISSQQASELVLSKTMLTINKKLIDLVEQDNRLYETEERRRLVSESNNSSKRANIWSKFSKDDDDDDDEKTKKYSSFDNDSGPRFIY